MKGIVAPFGWFYKGHYHVQLKNFSLNLSLKSILFFVWFFATISML